MVASPRNQNPPRFSRVSVPDSYGPVRAVSPNHFGCNKFGCKCGTGLRRCFSVTGPARCTGISLAGKKIDSEFKLSDLHFSLRILHATESQNSGTIHARRHHQKFTVLCQFICLGKIPDRSLRLVVTSASQDSASRVLVERFIGPLPNVADQVHHAERACRFWMSGDGIWAAHRLALVRSGDRGSIPLIPPRIKPAIGALGGILPLPFTRQPLSRPGRVRARILQG